jgi:hypothetical protein
MRIEGSFTGIKHQGREADHSPSSTAYVKNGGAVPPFNNTSSWRGAQLITQWANFNFNV